MKYEGWPDRGELVVGRVEEIENFGVFIDLLEYESKQGLVHISEVASGWIKNVRDHVRTGQTVVCKVLDVDETSQQIDLSLKDVNDHQRSEKIQEWKNDQKADKWLAIAIGEDVEDDIYRQVVGEMLNEFDTLYDGFEQAAILGNEAINDLDLTDEIIDAIVETARENVSVPYVTVAGYLDIECANPNGVDAIKETLAAAEGNGAVTEEIELKVTYVGAPEYRIEVHAPDYKTAEAELEASIERAESEIEEHGGTATFHRERHEETE